MEGYLACNTYVEIFHMGRKAARSGLAGIPRDEMWAFSPLFLKPFSPIALV